MMTYSILVQCEQLSCSFVARRQFYKQLRMKGFFRLPVEASLANGEKNPKAVQFV